MLCYKDKTWCTYTECIKSKVCKEFLSDEEKEKADKWWRDKDKAPIMRFTTKPGCYEED